MAFQIPLKLKTTFSPQGVPAASEMSFGELVVNASTGIVWTKKLDGTVVAIAGGDGGGPIGPITLEDITDVNNFWQDLILTSSTANEVKSKLNFGGPYAAQSHTHHISSITGMSGVGLSLASASTAGDARQVLNLGSMSIQNSNAVSITGGVITGMSDPVNPSGVSTANYTDVRDTYRKTVFGSGTDTVSVVIGSKDVVVDLTDLDINTVEELSISYFDLTGLMDGRIVKVYMSVDKNSIDTGSEEYATLLGTEIPINFSNQFTDGLTEIPEVLTPHYNISMEFSFSVEKNSFVLCDCHYYPIAYPAPEPVSPFLDEGGKWIYASGGYIPQEH
jgi:hypothetical protein